MRRFINLILPLMLLLAVGAAGAQAPLNVVATTTILADVARNVGGALVTVTSLVPANADPHAFEPTTEGAVLLARADLLLTVGAGYEQFLGGLLESVGADVPAYIVSNGIKILPYGAQQDSAADHDDGYLGILGDELTCTPDDTEADHDEAAVDHDHGACDPHVWLDAANVMIWADNIAKALTLADPDNAAVYRANADAYMDELSRLHLEILDTVAEIPEDRRVLVTNHEFMSYYARAYGFEVAATVLAGGSTGSEVAPQALANLIAQVQAEGVPAIFAETSANPQIAEVIAQETGIGVVTSLYSEALGGEGSPAPTYIDMMRYNTRTIVNALKG